MFSFLSGLSGVTGKIILIAAAIILAMSVAFYVYYRISSSDINALNAELTTTKTAIQEQNQTIANLQKITVNQKDSIESLQTQLSKAESDRAELATKVNNLNIVKNAQINRVQLQTTLNNDLNNLFNGFSGVSDVKSK
jgi:Tfp pilus assembly protein PilO